jgi:hypothetical protein
MSESREVLTGDFGHLEGVEYRVEDRGHDTPCWVWIRELSADGYGRVGGKGRAHRIYYQRATGESVAGKHVHHECHVRVCVNPEHLKAKTPSLHAVEHSHEKSKVTWADVREIRRRALAGEFAGTIWLDYPLTNHAVTKIILNRHWVDPDYTPPELQRVCSRPGCEARFTPTRQINIFCSRYCRDLHNNRKALGYYERRGIAA